MPEDRERLAREAVRKVLRDAPWQFSKEGNRQFFRDHMEVENIDMLVALARAGGGNFEEVCTPRSFRWHEGSARPS